MTPLARVPNVIMAKLCLPQGPIVHNTLILLPERVRVVILYVCVCVCVYVRTRVFACVTRVTFDTSMQTEH